MVAPHGGVAASPGIAIGRAQVYKQAAAEVVRTQIDNAEQEAERFRKAIEDAVQEIQKIEVGIAVDPALGEEQAKILEAHRLILQDPEFANRIEEQIRSEAINAEAALTEKADELVAMFEAMDNDYMRQRAADIRDISGRVMAKLQGVSYGFNAGDATDIIIVAEDLHPSDTIQLDLKRIRGFVTDIGGRTSHTAIMARTRGIPAVVGTQSLSETVTNGTWMIVDGEAGEVYVNPSTEEISKYEQKAELFAKRQQELQALVHETSTTKDGYAIELAANIGTPDDATIAMEYGAEGVGLFRSEFLFMNRSSLPTEDEQFAAYRQAATTLDGRPVIIRTMDIGGDKSLDYLGLPEEMNPFLGYRAIRVSLDRPHLFQVQLRAILRASHYGKIRVMYPMIASLDEVRQAKAALDAAKTQLREEGIPFDEKIEQGIMVEIPAAAIAADLIAPEVDFFSIGTNDLIQYTMACDRMNEKVSYLYQPYNPAVLRLVKMVIDAAHQFGKWVGMCGEMAGDVTVAPVLIGLGIDELSMSPTSILPIREVVRNGNHSQWVKLAAEVVKQPTAESVAILLGSVQD